MLTSKQRAKLRTLANPLETILQVGKGGIGEQLVKQVDDALRARELIKMRVLETAPGFPREIGKLFAVKGKRKKAHWPSRQTQRWCR